MNDKNIIVQGDYYEQSGNLGAGHVSESEIKRETKLGGIINEGKENLKTTQQEICQKATTKKRLAFAIAGSIEEVDQDKLEAIVALLRKITGDTSIEIVGKEKGSIKLILEGSQEGLEKLKALFDSGELTKVDDIPVEYVLFLDTEKSDDDEKIETDEESRLVEKIVNKETQEQYKNEGNLGIDLKKSNRATTVADKEIKTILAASLVDSPVVYLLVFRWLDMINWFRLRLAIVQADKDNIPFTNIENLNSGRYKVIQGIFNTRTKEVIDSRVIEAEQLDLKLKDIHHDNKLVVYR